MRKNPFIFYLPALLFTALLFSGCKSNDPEPDWPPCDYTLEFSPETDPAVSQSGISPLHPNNYWVYADSTRDETGQLTEAGELTLSITEVRRNRSEVWWSFSELLATMYQSGDTVYTLEYVYPTGCPNKRMEYYPPGQDTLYFTGVVEGDIAVMRKAHEIQETILTPSGNFDDCWFWSYEGWYEDIIQPEVGKV